METFRTEVGARLETALQEGNTSFPKLFSDTEQKIETVEQQLEQRSKETIEKNQSRTETLINQLKELKGQIREQIQQATGFTLFGAFQARQNEIVRGKNRWVYAIAALVAISAGVTVWIAHEAQYYSVNSFAFYVKLSLTIPLAFAITFFTVQYGRERRLEEEYAFKSSISVSLNPYRDLIQSLLERDAKADLTKYTDFVIDSVKNVFTPPTDKMFETEKKSGLTEATLKQAAELVGTVINAAKSK